MSISEPSLRILMERLRWPIRMVRWRAAQEMAALLGDKKYGKIALAVYLDWLCRREFESETVSALSVLVCAEEKILPKPAILVGHISTPSVLADVILQSLYGTNLKSGKWESQHSGRAPASFEPAAFFEKYQKSHVPPILSNSLQDLFDSSGIDLPKQWAYEWEQLMERTNSPYSGYPYYFLEGENRDSGVHGQFGQRQCDVYRSAFLRTLSFAVSIGMPANYAGQVSTETLPLNADFARIGPVARPSWLEQIPEFSCAPGTQIDDVGRMIVQKARVNTGRELLSIKIPLAVGSEKFADFSIRAVIASDDFKVDKTDSSGYDRVSPWLLGTGSSFDQTLPQDDAVKEACRGEVGSCIPLSLDIWPFPTGFWHSDYFQRGVAFPASYGLGGIGRARCTANGVEFLIDRTNVGQWQVWHDHWSPLYPKGGTTRCGMITTLDSDLLQSAVPKIGGKLGWIVSKRVWKSEKDYGELKEFSDIGFFFDSP